MNDTLREGPTLLCTTLNITKGEPLALRTHVISNLQQAVLAGAQVW